MEFLEHLYGLGPQNAKELFNRLVRENFISRHASKEEVLNALMNPRIYPDLPIATRIDITEHPDKKIPHEVLKVLDKELRTRIKGVKFDIAGSFRRKKPVSRDVDIVMSRGQFKTSLGVWKKFAQQIHKSRTVKFHKPFAGGNDKLSVLVTVSLTPAVLSQIKRNHPINPEFYKRSWKLKTDVFVTSPQEYMFMLLYATGSGSFNIMMRAQAKRKGYMLNQRGLYRRSDQKQISVKNEKHLFDILGITYRTPQARI